MALKFKYLHLFCVFWLHIIDIYCVGFRAIQVNIRAHRDIVFVSVKFPYDLFRFVQIQMCIGFVNHFGCVAYSIGYGIGTVPEFDQQ